MEQTTTNTLIVHVHTESVYAHAQFVYTVHTHSKHIIYAKCLYNHTGYITHIWTRKLLS